MNITVFGLGYVGCVTAACLARFGHNVVGVDVNPEKVRSINSGNSPITEPNLTQLISSGVSAGKIGATGDVAFAMEHADLALICVGTPSNQDGSLNLEFVERVCRDIGLALKNARKFIAVVVRSTMLPGVATESLIPILEYQSGKRAGIDFGFCVNPEFLREGSAIADFKEPPYTLIGQFDQRSGDLLTGLYSDLDAPVYRVSLGAAEMIKYASNTFHAIKVVFANEIGSLCQIHGVDSHEVMDVFVQDKKLNISDRYLRPGFAFGGSCLPKDLRALLHASRQHSLQLPALEAILPSNRLQIERVLQTLLNNGTRKVGMIGLSFKADTDDLRESPAVELAERMIGKGLELRIYDREVSLSRLHGSNRAYIEQAIPHIASLIQSSLEETVEPSEAIVVTKRPSNSDYKSMVNLLRADQWLLDLVRIDEDDIAEFQGKYTGVTW
jgi:GDP-mannose 6-dehydrogenase